VRASKENHCTLFPDGNWGESCCRAHDDAYAKGGTKADRLKADQRMRDCIIAKGHPVVARMMYRGVRMFGGSYFWPVKFNWQAERGR